MEKGRRPTVLEHLLEEEFVCSSLVCKERPGFSVTPQQSKHHYCLDGRPGRHKWRRPSLFFFFFGSCLPSQKRWQEFLYNRKDAMFLSSNPTYIYIYIFIMWSLLSVKKIQVDEVADPKSLS